MSKSVMDLGSELITLMRKRDDILYPSLDNFGNAYVSLYAIIATQVEFGLTRDEIVTRLEQKIVEVQKEIEVL